MKGGSHLDDGLQQSFFRFGCLEPDCLPMFMSREEFAAPVATQTVGQFSISPIEFHSFIAVCGDGQGLAGVKTLE